MPTMFDDVNAVCPFFKASDTRKVACEGITDDCTTILSFNSQNKRNQHRELFCDRQYQNCEVYKMLKEKYEDE